MTRRFGALHNKHVALHPTVDVQSSNSDTVTAYVSAHLLYSIHTPFKKQLGKNGSIYSVHFIEVFQMYGAAKNRTKWQNWLYL